MENIQEQMKQLFGGSCYAYCLAYKFTGDYDIKELTTYLLEGWKKGYIDDTGYVVKPVLYVNNILLLPESAKIKDVKKVDFKKSLLTEEINIVMYEYNGGTHFICMNKDGDVIFDPSGSSNSVKYGVPISIRKYIL